MPCLNEDGEVGVTSLVGSTDVPVQAANQQQIPAGVAALSAGLFSSSAVANDGTVWSWGRGMEGQRGNGDTRNSAGPVEALDSGGRPFIGSGSAITAVSSGLGRVMAVGDDGAVWIWGELIGGVHDAAQFGLFPAAQPVTLLPMCPTYVPVAVDIVNDLVASRGTPGPYGQADSLTALAPPTLPGPTTTVLLRWGDLTWGKLHIDTGVTHGSGPATPADNSNPRFRSAQALALGSASGKPVQDAPNSTTYRYYYRYTSGTGVNQVPCTRKVLVQLLAAPTEPGPKYIITTFDYPGSIEQ
jgi:Regulator of chromosome condensation (RCC1) repeat